MPRSLGRNRRAKSRFVYSGIAYDFETEADVCVGLFYSGFSRAGQTIRRKAFVIDVLHLGGCMRRCVTAQYLALTLILPSADSNAGRVRNARQRLAKLRCARSGLRLTVFVQSATANPPKWCAPVLGAGFVYAYYYSGIGTHLSINALPLIYFEEHNKCILAEDDSPNAEFTDHPALRAPTRRGGARPMNLAGSGHSNATAGLLSSPAQGFKIRMVHSTTSLLRLQLIPAPPH